MQQRSILVKVDWDDEAKVWVASSTDICGLAVEGETMEKLTSKVMAALHDLVEMNGFQSGTSDIPVHIMNEKMLHIHAAA